MVGAPSIAVELQPPDGNDQQSAPVCPDGVSQDLLLLKDVG
jgi:hypothetical protein